MNPAPPGRWTRRDTFICLQLPALHRWFRDRLFVEFTIHFSLKKNKTNKFKQHKLLLGCVIYFQCTSTAVLCSYTLDFEFCFLFLWESEIQTQIWPQSLHSSVPRGHRTCVTVRHIWSQKLHWKDKFNWGLVLLHMWNWKVLVRSRFNYRLQCKTIVVEFVDSTCTNVYKCLYKNTKTLQETYSKHHPASSIQLFQFSKHFNGVLNSLAFSLDLWVLMRTFTNFSETRNWRWLSGRVSSRE